MNLKDFLSRKLTYRAWWYCAAYKLWTETKLTAARDGELSRLQAGLVVNDYGDFQDWKGQGTYLLSNDGRHIGIRTQILDGFNRYRRCCWPIKHAARITSGLLDAIYEALALVHQFMKRRAAQIAAKATGFRSVAAQKRAAKAQEIAIAAERRRIEATRPLPLPDPYPDLNDYGIAPSRDLIEGSTLTLVNLRGAMSRRVNLAAFMALLTQYPTKIERRNAGWRLDTFIAQGATAGTRAALPFAPLRRKLAL